MSAVEQKPVELSYPEFLRQLKNHKATLLAEADELVSEADELTPIIALVEKLIARNAVPAVPSSRPVQKLSSVTAIHSRPKKMTHEPTSGPYSKMKFPAAARAYLASVGMPKTSNEVADGLKAGGFRTKAGNFAASVHAMLGRPSAQVLGIVRTAEKKWEVKS